MITVESLAHTLLVQLIGVGVKDPAITSVVRYTTGWQ